MQIKDKIALLLAQGISAANIASMVGCTPAYISQLTKDENFKLKILSMQNNEVPQKSDEELLSTKYESMEHRLLKAMETALEGADLRDITNALKTVADRQNAREKRKIPANQPNTTNQVIVQITLPQQIIPQLTLNTKNEVIAIDNRVMAPMTSNSVAQLFQARRALQEVPSAANTETLPLVAASDF